MTIRLINPRPCPARFEPGYPWPHSYDELRYDGWLPVKGEHPPRICICNMPEHIQAQLWPGSVKGTSLDDLDSE